MRAADYENIYRASNGIEDTDGFDYTAEDAFDDREVEDGYADDMFEHIEGEDFDVVDKDDMAGFEDEIDAFDDNYGLSEEEFERISKLS